MRLTLAISSMGSGGAERVMATLANRWVEQGHFVTLVSFSAAGQDFYPLDPRVRRVGLDLLRPSKGIGAAVKANIGRVRQLRRAIRTSTPDAVVSFMDTMNVLTLWATAGLRVPVVVSERVDPTASNPGRFWSQLRRVSYPMATALVVQTERVAQWAGRQGWTMPVSVIANPVDARFLAPLPTAARNKVIVGVGRFAEQKRFDRLVDAFDRVAPAYPGWSLVIAGDGPLGNALAGRIANCASASRMTLCGRVGDVGPLLRGSRVFVLSSDFEGFPNVLLEAMASGCAVIATDCPSGPAEIVRDGVNGLLVPPTVDGVAGALEQLLDEADRCRALGSTARRDSFAFEPDAIGRRWDLLLESLVSRTAVPALQVHADRMQ